MSRPNPELTRDDCCPALLQRGRERGEGGRKRELFRSPPPLVNETQRERETERQGELREKQRDGETE